MDIELRASIFDEVAEFIASGPSLEAVRDYRVSAAYQQQVDALLEKQRETGLEADERDTLEKILAVSHLMTLANAKARLKLAG